MFITKNLFSRILNVVEAAEENAADCMFRHDVTYGRDSEKNKLIGDTYEKERDEARAVLQELQNIEQSAKKFNV